MTKKKYTATDRLITKITGWVAGIMLLALVAWGIQTIWSFYNYEQTNDAQIEEYINPIISRSGGFIVAVKFEENELVKKGDTLLLIDNREYLIQQEQTEAAIQKEIAHIGVLESNIHTLKKLAWAVNSQITANEAKVWKQTLDMQRYEQLYQEQSATKQQLENMQETLAVNKSDYKSANDNYAAAISRIQVIQAEKLVAKAELNRLQAVLERNKLDVSYTVITASYNGRMGKRTVEVGQMIDVGEALAFIVNNETDKWIVANYKETQIAHMQIGDRVRFTADAFPDKEFSGTIISLAPATGSAFSLLPPDNSTGNFVKIVQRVPVRIKVNGTNEELNPLKAGMNVNVFVPKRQHANG